MEKLINLLLRLKSLPQKGSETYITSCLVFQELFYLGKSRIPKSKEDIEVVLALIADTSDKLSVYLDSFKTKFCLPWDDDEFVACVVRSGLQFLRDDFCNDENMNLTSDVKLREFLDHINFEELDSYMKQWKHVVTHLPERPIDIPETHFWWA